MTLVELLLYYTEKGIEFKFARNQIGGLVITMMKTNFRVAVAQRAIPELSLGQYRGNTEDLVVSTIERDCRAIISKADSPQELSEI